MKEFKIKEENIKELISWQGADGCMATDKIVVDGEKVGYMYREKPTNESDSGWRFFDGNETEEYLNNADNIGIYKLNTICNYDEAIIPYLNMKIGTKLSRNSENKFVEE